MANIVIVGSGFAGHFAAMTLSDELRKRKIHHQHSVRVITKTPKFTYIPSLIWVGIGQMPASQTQFELAPVYSKLHIQLTVGTVTEVHPDNQFVVANTSQGPEQFPYDYLIMATGPYLNFAATPGLGPDQGHTYSVCTPDHAIETAHAYEALIHRLESGEAANVVIGTGHGTCTCQGAALEFLFNVHTDLEHRGLRHLTHLTWLSNEPKLGDLGIGGVEAKRQSTIMSSEELMAGLFEGHHIDHQIQSHVFEIDDKEIHFETLQGDKKTLPYDFAMLLPPFKGQPIRYMSSSGEDITDQVCNPAGFVKVDAVYGKTYDDLDGPDWPKTYQSPIYSNLFAAGIAFAPPGPLSQPNKSPNGTLIGPAPPRTGFTSELCGRAAALNIVELIENRPLTHSASMAETAGICVASMDNHLLGGNAMVIGIYPVARNYAKYPEYGRDLDASEVDLGMAGAWMKRGLHHAFMYKLQGKPFWKLVP